jgi:gamma-glutamyltranspeptidase
MIVKIGGVEVDYEIGSIDVDNAINERSTASFSIIDKEGTSRFYKGQPVEIITNAGATVEAIWNDDDLTTSWEIGL